MTSGGDFFGGTQVALTDIMEDHTFLLTILSVRGYRIYDGQYINLSRRFHYGVQGFDRTQFFYPNYYIPTSGFSRDGVLATQRYRGGLFIGQYPLDKQRRIDVSAGVIDIREQYDNDYYQQLVQQQAVQTGQTLFLNNGTYVPFSVRLTEETTKFASFGPLDGKTFSLGAEAAPPIARHPEPLHPGRRPAEVHPPRLELDPLRPSPLRVLRPRRQPLDPVLRRKQRATGIRLPLVLGQPGIPRQRGAPLPPGEPRRHPHRPHRARARHLLLRVRRRPLQGPARTSSPPPRTGFSYVNDPVFGEPVSGFRLVDGRASFGFGLQVFVLGYPMHFDWSRLTDMQKASPLQVRLLDRVRFLTPRLPHRP